MNDLVERLRDADANSQQRVWGSRIFGEAADRIEALERENAELATKLMHAEARAIPTGRDLEAGRLEAEFYARWLHAGNSTGSLSPHAIDGLADSFARAILAAREQARREALEEAAKIAERHLEDMKSMQKMTASYAIRSSFLCFDSIRSLIPAEREEERK